MDLTTRIFIWLVVAVTSASTVLLIAEVSGFLPDRLTRFFARKRAAASIEVLRHLGVDVEGIRCRNLAEAVPNLAPGDYRAEVTKRLANLTVGHAVDVGKTEASAFPGYIDLMGATTSPANAVVFARVLSSHLRTLVRESKLKTLEFDFVATPKEGSPILSYELAKLLEKPLFLHPSETKFRSAEPSLHAEFDFAGTVPPPGSVALVVDDSTTGGRKVVDMVKALRRRGYTVTDALVVFAPQGKGASDRLQGIDVLLHWIVEGPSITGGR